MEVEVDAGMVEEKLEGEEEEDEEEEEEPRRRRRTALIKSNNPHLAGGEKYKKNTTPKRNNFVKFDVSNFEIAQKKGRHAVSQAVPERCVFGTKTSRCAFYKQHTLPWELQAKPQG